ncbi:MAG: STAS domain-containing protein [Candidatus Aminicenantes bacterium]|nr:MAG: STAS domain-containing protein [Candidatus Aminicenantes bacterium]
MVEETSDTAAGEEGENLVKFLQKNEKEIADAWITNRLKSSKVRTDLIPKEDMDARSTRLLKTFTDAISRGNLEDITRGEYDPLNKLLDETSKELTARGFTLFETGAYFFSLKDTMLEYLQKEYTAAPDILNQVVMMVAKLFDTLALTAFDSFLKGREKTIKEYVKVTSEMATPILFLWKEILFLPIVGVVDSKRAQTIMEQILQQITEKNSKILIMDILGVAVVDSAVANHIIKITRATKLMGCESIITGISSSIAQTMVSLGIDLGGLITKSTLIDGLEYSFNMLGYRMIQDPGPAKK